MRRLIALAAVLSFLACGLLDRASSARAGTVSVGYSGIGYGSGHVNDGYPPNYYVSGPVTLWLGYDWKPGIVGATGGYVTIFNLDSLGIGLRMENTPFGLFSISAQGLIKDEIIVTVPPPAQGPPTISFIAEDQTMDVDIELIGPPGSLTPGVLPDSLAALADSFGQFDAGSDFYHGNDGDLQGTISPLSPEPPSIILMVIGLAGASGLAARRRGRRDGAVSSGSGRQPRDPTTPTTPGSFGNRERLGS